jgi:hypothetical protein
MDRHQLVTIAITALVSVTAKEVLTWLVAWAKIKAASETIKAKTKSIFNKNSLRIVVDAVCSGGGIWLLSSEIHDKAPLTRWAVFKIAFDLFAAVFWVTVTLRDIISNLP